MPMPSPIPRTLTVTGLWIYPVKSCAGIALGEAILTARGLPWDREWMVVRPDGTFVTQRQLPRLALLSTALEADALRLRTPDGDAIRVPWDPPGTVRSVRQVTVWKHACPALDEGEAVASWLTAFLGTPLRLVRFHPDHRRLSDRGWTGGVEAENAFSDGFPILVLSEESLADLNRRIGGTPLPMDRFRPNLVVTGGGPYVEDEVKSLAGDGFELRLVKPCARCPITTTDQRTAEVVGREPLATLATYRRDERLGGVVFGQNAIVAAGTGRMLRVGMRLEGR